MAISLSFIVGVLVATATLNVVHAARFICYKSNSLTDYVSTPLIDPLGILPCLNASKSTWMHTHGFNGKRNGPETVAVLTALMEQSNVVVILLDWEIEATGLFPNILGYPSALAAAKIIATVAGKSLLKLIENGILVESIHLFGHSLGAHMMGWIAKTVRNESKSQYLIPRITGLDPAGAGFETPLGLEGLNPSQAQFVDVVHTNCGLYAIDYSAGHVDFWANCAKCDNNQRQPGCPAGVFFPLTDQSLCSHTRSVYLYVESLRNSNSYPAAFANNCSDWRSQTTNTQTNYMGLNVDSTKPGNFYFSTNSQSPFSKGQAGIAP